MKQSPVSPIILARNLMVYWARKNLGSRMWNESSILNFSEDKGWSLTLTPASIDTRAPIFAYKCNLFVADMAAMAGAKTWVPIVNASVGPNMPQITREPTASEWASPSFPILGWKVVKDPDGGDVASNGSHMGIVSDKRTLISASSIAGMINETDLTQMRYRRFFGLTESEVMSMMPSEKPERRKVRCY